MITALLDEERFSDIRFVQNGPVIGEAFGVKKQIPSDDTILLVFDTNF